MARLWLQGLGVSDRQRHEAFVAALEASGVDHCVVRPTGFFSDMGAYLEMAGKGRV